jgi:hypothetical protein
VTPVANWLSAWRKSVAVRGVDVMLEFVKIPHCEA